MDTQAKNEHVVETFYSQYHELLDHPCYYCVSPFTTYNFCLGKKKPHTKHKLFFSPEIQCHRTKLPWGPANPFTREGAGCNEVFSDFVLCSVQVCVGIGAGKGVSCLPPTGTAAVSTSVSRQKWQAGTGNELTLAESGPASWQHARVESRLLLGFWELGCCCHHPLQLLLTGLGICLTSLDKSVLLDSVRKRNF